MIIHLNFSERSCRHFLNKCLKICTKKKRLESGDSVERMYLRQRCFDGWVNKTILKPRVAAAASRANTHTWDFQVILLTDRQTNTGENIYLLLCRRKKTKATQNRTDHVYTTGPVKKTQSASLSHRSATHGCWAHLRFVVFTIQPAPGTGSEFTSNTAWVLLMADHTSFTTCC